MNERPPRSPVPPETLFKAFGFEFALPRWAKSLLAAVVVSGVGATVWFSVVAPHLQQDKIALSRTTLAQLGEYNKHYGEAPTYQQPVYRDARGETDIAFYASDGCLHVTRKSSAATAPEVRQWVMDPATVPPSAPPHLTGGIRGLLAHEAQAQTRCLNPHPGAFTWWAVPQGPCWQNVYRQWPDGCQHVQAFNTCYGTSGPVTWLSCRH